jgi:hypothetical protein
MIMDRTIWLQSRSVKMNESSGEGGGRVHCQHAAVCIWTGTQMIAWGGTDGNANYNTGGCYDPVANAWMLLLPLSAARALRPLRPVGWQHDADLGRSQRPHRRPQHHL